MAAGATRALDELVRAGITHTVHEYAAPEPSGRGHGSERRPAWGEDAATALGLDRARIHKTLVAVVDGRLAVAVVPVDAELDLKRFADALGGRKAGMADPAEAERATGYVRGGISPLGQRRRLPTVVRRSGTGPADDLRFGRPARPPGRARACGSRARSRRRRRPDRPQDLRRPTDGSGDWQPSGGIRSTGVHGPRPIGWAGW